jgi:prolyl oligopeptidase
VDLQHPARQDWRELLPQAPQVLEGTGIVGGALFASYLVDATSRFFRFDLEGGSRTEIPLPTLGSLGGLGGEWDGQELFYGFSSFTVPPTIYRYDLLTGTSSLWGRVQAGIDPEDYEIHQVRCTSRDGTRLPLFVVHRRGLVADGHRPTLLTGYGGFNVSLTPGFSRSTFLWLQSGGVYAVANLRGGGEYGTAWHEAGRLGHKQNVFDDFLAAARWLIDAGYTCPQRLAIMGGSNGGLLVGAALTQRPDLFRAVVCSVPLLDMLRYHRFRLARLWVSEYGSSEDPQQFSWLYAYSPYHRVQEGRDYPAVLLLTGESDSRVDPMHARKMAARLQQAQASDKPILLRVETRSGHGAGKPLAKILDEATDTWTFLFDQLEVEVHD